MENNTVMMNNLPVIQIVKTKYSSVLESSKERVKLFQFLFPVVVKFEEAT